MKPYFEDGGVTIYHGDCREVIPQLTERFHACITDPPYHLTSASRNGSPRQNDPETPFGRTKLGSAGFMGKTWDGGDVAFRPETWRAVLNALNPGSHLMAFGGTRTNHRMACAIEDAGFEIRDTLMWLYGSGFPKSLDISKAIDKAADAEREVLGFDDSRNRFDGASRVPGKGSTDYGSITQRGANPITKPATDAAKIFDGYGTALKPAYEPIILGMKPLDGTFAGNALKHGVAGLDIKGSRIDGGNCPLREARRNEESDENRKAYSKGLAGSKAVGETEVGRWPANVILDEETAAMVDEQTGDTSVTGARSTRSRSATVDGTNWLSSNHKSVEYPDDFGGASRFFYTAKAASAERSANMTGATNNHPTVKPLDLMRYLCRLLAPPRGGILLEPFMGSGSTVLAGRRFFQRVVAIELEEQYCEIAAKRLSQTVLGLI